VPFHLEPMLGAITRAASLTSDSVALYEIA